MGPKKRSSDVQLGASKKKKKTDTTGQVFLPSYTVQFPWIRKSNASKYKAHCMICMDDFGINHGGKSDIERHEGTDKHDKNSKLNKSTTSLNFATATSTDRVEKLLLPIAKKKVIKWPHFPPKGFVFLIFMWKNK